MAADPQLLEAIKARNGYGGLRYVRGSGWFDAYTGEYIGGDDAINTQADGQGGFRVWGNGQVPGSNQGRLNPDGSLQTSSEGSFLRDMIGGAAYVGGVVGTAGLASAAMGGGGAAAAAGGAGSAGGGAAAGGYGVGMYGAGGTSLGTAGFTGWAPAAAAGSYGIGMSGDGGTSLGTSGFTGYNPGTGYGVGMNPSGGTSLGTGGGWLDTAGSLLNSPIGASLVGAGLGAIAGNQDMTGTSSHQMTSSQTQQLAPWLQPYAQDYVARAQEVANKPFQQYGGQYAAGMTADEQRGLGMIGNAAAGAGQGSYVGAAGNQLTNTINGAYLNSNPYLDQMYGNASSRVADAFARGTQANTNGAFGAGGIFGGSAHKEMIQANNATLGDQLNRLATDIYAGNYQAERDRQQQATLSAPGFDQTLTGTRLGAGQALMQAGSVQRGIDDRNLAGQYNEFLRGQNWDASRIGLYGQAINPAFGSSTTGSQTSNSTVTQPGVGWAAGAAGGALGGLGVYNAWNQANRGQTTNPQFGDTMYRTVQPQRSVY